MTEAEWLACCDPEPMLLYLKDRASKRKLRLYAVACAGPVEHFLQGRRRREVLQLAERWADEGAAPPQLDEAVRRNYKAMDKLGPYTAAHIATGAVNAVAGAGAWAAAWVVVSEVRRALWEETRRPVYEVGKQQADLLRHIMGNPFHLEPFEPAWRTPGALAIARAAYEDQRWHDLPFLADAVEDAGCPDAVLLEHLRAGGEHLRGCWALDLVLGRV